MLAEDNKLAGTSRNPCWLTSYKSSRVLILKEIPKRVTRIDEKNLQRIHTKFTKIGVKKRI